MHTLNNDAVLGLTYNFPYQLVPLTERVDMWDDLMEEIQNNSFDAATIEQKVSEALDAYGDRSRDELFMCAFFGIELTDGYHQLLNDEQFAIWKTIANRCNLINVGIIFLEQVTKNALKQIKNVTHRALQDELRYYETISSDEIHCSINILASWAMVYGDYNSESILNNVAKLASIRTEKMYRLRG